MIKYDVLVTGSDVRYHENFIVGAISKIEAMKKSIAIARKRDNVSGELSATARIVRS